MPRFAVRDFGTCLNFPGSANYAAFADSASLDIANAITLSAWILIRSYGESSQGRIIDKLAGASGYGLTVNDASGEKGLRGLVTGTGRTSNSNILQLNKWFHVGMTYHKDGGSNNLIFYVNGASAGSTTETGTITNTASECRIGSNTNTDRDFNGYIDEVKIYSRALTSTEMSNEYYGFNYSTSGLVLYAKFDEGSGTAAIDSSGNQANGTISGATYATNVRFKPRTAVA